MHLLIGGQGTSWEGKIEFRHRGNEDDAAEATFIIKDAPTPMSFSLIVRPKPNDIKVEYHERLSSLNNPIGSNYSLGFENDGGIIFILAGDSKNVPFVSSNPPIAWSKYKHLNPEILSHAKTLQCKQP